MAGNGTENTNEIKTDAAVAELREHRYKRDSWYNYRSRFGSVTRDPVMVSSYVRNRDRIKRAEAETLYEFDWLTAKVVDQVAKDSTREWIRLTHDNDPDKAEKLRQEDVRLNGLGVFEESIRLARLHGGNVLVLGAWDGGQSSPEEPLKLERVQKVAWTANVDRWLAFPQDWYRDQEDPKYGTTETYVIHRLAVVGSAVSVVHESRTIRFDGNPLPPLARVRNWNWGASVIDKVYDALRNWGMSNQAAASIIPSFITYAMKIENLQQLIANGQWSVIQTRVGEAFAQMATQNMMTYGQGEEIQKMGTPVSGLPDLIDRFMKIVSGAVDIPMSILFQAESGGLGGTASQTDRDNWFDSIKAYQETYLRPRVRYWLDVIGMGLGLKPGEVEFEFVSLKQQTPQQESEIYSKNAQADQTYINAGVVQPEQVALHRFSGQKYNEAPLVFDTEREEKILEMIKKQPIELGQQDQFRVPFTGDPEMPEGEGGEGGEGGGTEGGPGEQAPTARDSADEDYLHINEHPELVTHEDLDWYQDQLNKQDKGKGGATVLTPAPTPEQAPSPPSTMRIRATRNAEGELEATVEEVRKDVSKQRTDWLVSHSEVKTVLGNFKNEDAADYARKLVAKFGPPNELSESWLTWYAIDQFQETAIRDESVAHDFPKPHRDFVYSIMPMEVPESFAEMLRHVTGSIIYDGLKKTVTARCGALMANAITLDFVKDVVAFKIHASPEKAKIEYGKRIKRWKAPNWYNNELGE